MTATATATAQAIRPARRKTGAQRRSRPSPSHPTPTRAVPQKPSKPVNDSGALAREASLTRRPVAGADASRTAAIVVTAASEVRAAAARLELLRERWILTGLEMA